MFPRRNLPSNAEPWGREVEKQISDLANEVRNLRFESTNSFKAVNASIGQIIEQQAALEEAQQTLTQQQEAIAVQQANMITIRTQNRSGVTTLPAFGTGASLWGAVTVPQGYTKASITYSLSTYINTIDQVFRLANFDMTVHTGGDSLASSATVGDPRNFSRVWTPSVSGLSGGQTLTVNSYSYSASSSSISNVQWAVGLNVLFFK